MSHTLPGKPEAEQTVQNDYQRIKTLAKTETVGQSNLEHLANDEIICRSSILHGKESEFRGPQKGAFSVPSSNRKDAGVAETHQVLFILYQQKQGLQN